MKYRIINAHIDWNGATLQIRPMRGLTRDYTASWGTPRYSRILLAITYAALLHGGDE